MSAQFEGGRVLTGRSNAEAYQKMVEDEWVSRDTVESWARWHDKLTIGDPTRAESRRPNGIRGLGATGSGQPGPATGCPSQGPVLRVRHLAVA